MSLPEIKDIQLVEYLSVENQNWSPSHEPAKKDNRGLVLAQPCYHGFSAFCIRF